MLDAQKFLEAGYFTHAFTHIEPLQKLVDFCKQQIRESTGQELDDLGKYHLLDIAADTHESLQYELFSRINEQQLHWRFVEQNLAFFHHLVGRDMDVQTETYVRIARPGEQKDNIGIHRDTDYGNSAYELSISLPLIDQSEGAGLNVVPGSHLIENYQFKQHHRDDVVKGTDKNKMGFLYAPKVPDESHKEGLLCVSLPFGSGLVFTLGLLHGQVANQSNTTRWSIDFRFKNAHHPVSPYLKAGYYSPFSQSEVGLVAHQYYLRNQDEYQELTGEPMQKPASEGAS